MPWFRMYDDFLDDLKVADLTLHELKTYLGLMCYLSKINHDRIKNEEPINDYFIFISCKKRAKSVQKACKRCAKCVQIAHLSQLAERIKMQKCRLQKALEGLESARLITIENNKLYINGWGRRQQLSDYSYKRVKKYRKEKCNVSETDNRYIDDVDVKEKKIQKKKRKPDKCPYEDIKNLWNEMLGEKCGFIDTIYKTRKSHVKARWENQMPSLELWEVYFKKASRISWLVNGFESKKEGRFVKARNFDWLINETNYHKIVEGKYDDKN